jgi:hypothetical protein
VLELGKGPPKSLEDLVYEATARIKNLPIQTAVLKPIGRRSIQFRVPEVRPAVAKGERVTRFVQEVFELSGLTKTIEAIQSEIGERQRTLGAPTEIPLDEPESFREPIAPIKAPAPRARRAG